jgi:hypothetical protein
MLNVNSWARPAAPEPVSTTGFNGMVDQSERFGVVHESANT